MRAAREWRSPVPRDRALFYLTQLLGGSLLERLQHAASPLEMRCEGGLEMTWEPASGAKTTARNPISSFAGASQLHATGSQSGTQPDKEPRYRSGS